MRVVSPRADSRTGHVDGYDVSPVDGTLEGCGGNQGIQVRHRPGRRFGHLDRAAGVILSAVSLILPFLGPCRSARG